MRAVVCSLLVLGVLASASGAPALAQGRGQPVVTLSASPVDPVVGAPVRIELSIRSQNGPLGVALLSSYPVEASSGSTGNTIQAIAYMSPLDPGAYSATLTFPSPGLWRISSPVWSTARGNPLEVNVPGCQFTLGFAALHDQIPDVVGACTSDKQHSSISGDALQTTTTGLLVWRKLDNRTVFTDGASTWIDGPLGLQQRHNQQRFWWESNPDRLPVVPVPRPGDRCHTAGLSLAHTDQGDVGAGHAGTYFTLTNVLDVPCVLAGYVGAQLLDAQGESLPTSVTRGNGYLFHDGGPVSLLVPPAGSARFGLEWVQVPVGDETSCPTASQLAIIPPDEYGPLAVPARIMACDAGQLHVIALEPLNALGPAPDHTR
jgi:Protein of unknown function (DUF4232)